jgi:cyclopropane-fatty-acyl-phospholipid synthase
MEKLFEKFILNFVRHGSLAVETPSGRRIQAGDGSGPPVAIRLRDEQAETRLLTNPELAFGELYMNGAIEVTQGDLLDAMQVALRNLAQEGEARWMTMLRRLRTTLRAIEQRNDSFRARRNVAHHYDLDARLYDFFLDEDRQYSCAYFATPDETLDAAQLAKKRHVAAKLLIEPGHTVLDIGCGWGGMGLYLARMCGARVTGVTLSDEQLAIAQQRARDSGLPSPPNFLLQDYRDVPGSFDRIVSVGMFEHVGVGYYDTFFQKVASLLDRDGVALLHTIGRPDQPCATNPFIAKYIFPGGHLPSLSEVMPSIERAGLIVTDIEVLRLHYADTLRAWRERFQQHRAEIARLYDERFCRMWEFYLVGSEATFRLGQGVVFQIQMSKRIDAVPVTRDYIHEAEAALREKEDRELTRENSL